MRSVPFVPGEECPMCHAHVFSPRVIVTDAHINRWGAVVVTYRCRCGYEFFCRWANLAYVWQLIKDYLGYAYTSTER